MHPELSDVKAKQTIIFYPQKYILITISIFWAINVISQEIHPYPKKTGLQQNKLHELKVADEFP
ncbi:MAG: hypothetical protein A3F16_07910 [Deltaproteobacteria bacterium RIFCSPHIGHO2_12_FULL_43_9]|nr:MAG: hypothetical protein A3F16_07910 [Deltaproteobacteria bacterium RIFCSPHIGHO2_12_FULL_43_9]